jgi:serine/threonine-protein kinase HipA
VASTTAQNKTLFVLMDGVLVGEVGQDRSGRVRLLYDEDYLVTPGAVPLSLSMPLVARRYKNASLGPWLEGLLPDRHEVLTRWRREFKVGDTSTFALLRHVGEEVAGAAQFVRPDRVEEATNEGAVSVLTEADIAERLRILQRDPFAWEPATGGGQFSLAGSQSKFAIWRDGDRWGVPTGRTPTTHILKPAIRDLADQDLNQHLTMEAARRLGMRVPLSEVLSFEDQRAFVVRRYDRVPDADGRIVRVHQEDMCQALGRPPSEKYEEHDGPTAEDIARLIREQVDRERIDEDVRRFADAIVFNWLIVGTDAHAKNYSILLAADQVRLAPLYDLNSYLPYIGTQKPKLSMKIGSYKVRPDLVGREDWKVFARQIGLPEDEVFSRIVEMSARIADAFSDAASEPGVRSLRSDLPALLVDRIHESAQRRAAVGSATETSGTSRRSATKRPRVGQTGNSE